MPRPHKQDQQDLLNANRQRAIKFYQESLDKIVDPVEREWRRSQVMNEVSGIDHTKAEDVILIPAGTIFQQRQGDVWTKGFYYSEVGISPSDVGIAGSGAITGYPKEFTNPEFIKEYHHKRRDVIQETEALHRELTDKELSDLHHRNAEIAKSIAIEIGIKQKTQELKKEILKTEGKARELTQDEKKNIKDDVTNRIKRLRVPEGKELPIIKYSDLSKPMRLYQLKEDTLVYVSHAKGTEPGASPLQDTWSRIRAVKPGTVVDDKKPLTQEERDSRSAMHDRKPIPVTVKGGAIQYYSVETDHFTPITMTLKEYMEKAKKSPHIVPPKPEEVGVGKPKPGYKAAPI